MAEKVTPLRRRIAPAVTLKLELSDDSGDVLIRNFRLSLDFNAACLIQEKTGKSLLDGATWEDVSPVTLSTMFYAAILANQPEYDTRDLQGDPTDEGLEVIRSYMDAGNAKQIQEGIFDAFISSLPAARQAEIKVAREKAAEKAKGPNEPAPAEILPMPAAAASAS